MTLLREIQRLLEHTYGATGVNFEHFLLGRERAEALARLAGASAAQISQLGRVFLREIDGQLRLGIYYDPQVIAALERNNPAYGVNDFNILPFMVLIEELDHAVHASLQYREGRCDIQSETFVRDLELQSKIDTYLVLELYCAHFSASGRITEGDRRWITACVFDAGHYPYDDPLLLERYHETNRLGRRYVRHLNHLAPARRTAEIRRFRKMTYARKQRRIATLARSRNAGGRSAVSPA